MSEPARKIQQTPESYTPKDKPELLRMMEQSTAETNPQAEVTPAASTIPLEKRNSVRVIELPACKMVWSGVAKDAFNESDSAVLKSFEKWMNGQDALRRDRFYSRDFMW